MVDAEKRGTKLEE